MGTAHCFKREGLFGPSSLARVTSFNSTPWLGKRGSDWSRAGFGGWWATVIRSSYVGTPKVLASPASHATASAGNFPGFGAEVTWYGLCLRRDYEKEIKKDYRTILLNSAGLLALLFLSFEQLSVSHLQNDPLVGTPANSKVPRRPIGSRKSRRL